MRKSSKALSLVLAGLTATSCFTGLSAISAAADTTLVYFQFPEDEAWGPLSGVQTDALDKSNVYCNVYAISGNTTTYKGRGWEVGSTQCTNEGNGIFSFDTSAQGVIEPGAIYGILFSTQANKNTKPKSGDGFQTCDIIFTADCLGDTVKLIGGTRENGANSEKIDYLGEFVNHPECGPLKKIASLGSVLPGKFAPGQDRGIPLAQALKDYLPNPTNVNAFNVTRNLQICEEFETTPLAVYKAYVNEYGEYLEEKSWTEPNEDDTNAPDTEIVITKNTPVEGDDTSRKYVKTTTTYKYNKKKRTYVGSAENVAYPTLDYVMERLALTEDDLVEGTTAAPVEETTVEPTTVEPTTVEPTTVEPTTVEPTTVEPTTVEPTTVEPTTVEPTTVEPTTVEPTTVEPTTVEPTTEEPVAEPVVIVAGNNSELFGTAWNGADTNNQMTKDGDVYTKTYTADKAYADVQLKAVVNVEGEDAKWYGDETGANVTFNVTEPSDFTVTYDPKRRQG